MQAEGGLGASPTRSGRECPDADAAAVSLEGEAPTADADLPTQSVPRELTLGHGWLYTDAQGLQQRAYAVFGGHGLGRAVGR